MNLRVLYYSNICKQMQNVVFIQGKVLVLSFWGHCPRPLNMVSAPGSRWVHSPRLPKYPPPIPPYLAKPGGVYMDKTPRPKLKTMRHLPKDDIFDKEIRFSLQMVTVGKVISSTNSFRMTTFTGLLR